MGKALYVEAGVDGGKIILTDSSRPLKILRRGSNGAPLGELEQTLRDFLQGEKVQDACLILSTEKTILRFASLPFLSPKELTQAVSFLYEDYFPIPKEQYCFSYRRLEPYTNKTNLLLAAIPLALAEDYASAFQRVGIRLLSIDILESAAGLIAQTEPTLCFAKQESTYRIFGLKDKIPQGAWRVTNHPEEGPRELRAALSGLEEAGQIHRCVFYGGADDWLLAECERYELIAGAPPDNFAVLESRARVSALPGSQLNLIPPARREIIVLRQRLRKALILECAFILLTGLILSGARLALPHYQRQKKMLNEEINTLATASENTETERLTQSVERMQTLSSALAWTQDTSALAAQRILSLLSSDIQLKSAFYQDAFLSLTLTAQNAEAVSDFLEQARGVRGDLVLSVQPALMTQHDDGVDITLHIILRRDWDESP
ncbi:MAG: hypothetical protein LBT44_01350 [Clostridiales bacterium]|jgi:hypothetical protein|nr:hypothetical protein [Clostridiales bacterium]